MLIEEQGAHLNKCSKNREKKSGKTDEQRFANVRDDIVPVLAVQYFVLILLEWEEPPYVLGKHALGNLDHSVF